MRLGTKEVVSLRLGSVSVVTSVSGGSTVWPVSSQEFYSNDVPGVDIGEEYIPTGNEDMIFGPRPGTATFRSTDVPGTDIDDSYIPTGDEDMIE